MTSVSRPRLRPLEVFPVGEEQENLFALRDPEGFADAVVLPYPAAVLATLFDGRRTLAQVQRDFHEQVGSPVALADVEAFLAQLDERYLLDTPRFRAAHRAANDAYLNDPVRPAAHAGGAYAGDADELRRQLAELFTSDKGPGGPPGAATRRNGGQLRGVLSPHIDLHRGGPAFAWAYKRLVEECDADLFVIFGTAHNALRRPFSVSRKDYSTPLGTVATDQEFIAALAANAQAIGDAADRPALRLFDDELAHRHEHSIEFQAVFLQYVLGERRPFRIVPILTGSFHEYYEQSGEPIADPAVATFVEAMRRTVADHPGRVAFISGGDLSHVGRRFGDRELLGAAQLATLKANDRQLLDSACRADSRGFFRHVADQQDETRVCGLAPTYTMLEVMRPRRGELLTYDQAVEPDGSACVSFASMAFYDDA